VYVFSCPNTKDNLCSREQAPVGTINVEVLYDKLCRMFMFAVEEDEEVCSGIRLSKPYPCVGMSEGSGHVCSVG